MAKTVQNEVEQIVDRVVDEMNRTLEGIPESEPFGTEKLSPMEQLQRYLEMRDDFQAWAELMEEQGMKATLRYATTMERRMSKEIKNHAEGTG